MQAAEDTLKRIYSLGTLANQVAGTTSISNQSRFWENDSFLNFAKNGNHGQDMRGTSMRKSRKCLALLITVMVEMAKGFTLAGRTQG